MTNVITKEEVQLRKILLPVSASLKAKLDQKRAEGYTRWVRKARRVAM